MGVCSEGYACRRAMWRPDAALPTLLARPPISRDTAPKHPRQADGRESELAAAHPAGDRHGMMHAAPRFGVEGGDYMAGFEAKTSSADGRAVVALVGECDLAVREELTSLLVATLDSARFVVLDLSELRFMDSSGIHALVAGHHAALEKGRRLYVRNAGGAVAEVLELTGVGDLLRPPTDDPDPSHE
jgi:anti-sigma B factor antagonist